MTSNLEPKSLGSMISGIPMPRLIWSFFYPLMKKTIHMAQSLPTNLSSWFFMSLSLSLSSLARSSTYWHKPESNNAGGVHLDSTKLNSGLRNALLKLKHGACLSGSTITGINYAGGVGDMFSCLGALTRFRVNEEEAREPHPPAPPNQ